MTKTIVVFLLWFLPGLMIAQTFTVIKVNGTVLSTALKREVKTGDLITTNDKLTFSNKDSYLHVFNPAQGRKTFRNVPDTSPRELMVLLEKFAAKDKNRMKSRGDGIDYVTMLAGKFKFDTVLVVGNGLFPVDTAKMTLRSPAGVVAEFQMNGAKQKMTISEADGFSLSASKLFGSSLNSYPPIVVWYFEDIADPLFRPSTQIGSFVPLYVNEASLKNEIKTIVASMNTRGKEDVIHSILDFLSQEYAPAVEENLNAWLTANKLL
jgi:hypothetical protein